MEDSNGLRGLRRITIWGPVPEVIKLFSWSTQPRTKFRLLIITTNKEASALSLSDVVFIMLINVKMPKLLAF